MGSYGFVCEIYMGVKILKLNNILYRWNPLFPRVIQVYASAFSKQLECIIKHWEEQTVAGIKN